MDPTVLDSVVALERELQTIACRSNPDRVRQLLAEDFEEVGASGKVWDLRSTLALLDSEGGDAAEIEVHDLVARQVAEGIVMVRWDSDRGGRRARRTSLWRQEGTTWRLVHHQGTLLST